MASVSITSSNILTVLRAFLLNVLPAGVEVIKGQVNRVPEPAGQNFVVMTPMFRDRLATNIDTYADAVFTGSIAGTTMTIASVGEGAISVGSTIFGVGVTANTTVTAFGTGRGGTGTYTVSPSQTVSPTKTLAAGTQELLQPVKVTVQLDIHGPASEDNSQIITTLFRDAYAVDFFAASGYDVAPLFASEPKQMPFINGEQQYEDRWTVDAYMQANPFVIVPQQFAAALAVNLVEVDAAYPPAP